VAALGNFDGVHAGHISVLKTAQALAERLGAPLVAAVFKPHPRRFFMPQTEPFRLMSDTQRARALGQQGAERVFHIGFDKALAALSPEAFCEDVLAGQLGLRGVVTGRDFRFGKNRAGDVDALKELGQRFGFEAQTAPEITADDDKISSTLIRNALAQGDVKRAESLLGQPWAIEGVVSQGDQRGRTLGFPTANTALGDYVRPKFGVYAVKARREGETDWHPGVANLGRRPTVEGTEARLETHLFDFEADLYGQTLEVQLVDFIRGEVKFDGLDALKAQIAADCETARSILGV